MLHLFVIFLIVVITQAIENEHVQNSRRKGLVNRNLQKIVLEGGVCNTMVPPSPLAPGDSSCWDWYVPPADGVLTSDMSDPPKGCDYAPCQDAVCACDPYCCNSAWDLSCRGYYMKAEDVAEDNYFAPKCSAKLLCCEPESTSIPDTSNQCAPGEPECCETMIPPSYFPPDDSTCWQWWIPPANGKATPGMPDPQKGCDYQPCEDAVCACDPYCCNSAWDLSCRGYFIESGDELENNYFKDACSAKLLCCETQQ